MAAILDTILDKLENAFAVLTNPTAGRDSPPDYRDIFKRTVLLQFGLALFLSIWEPNLSGAVAIFGYIALTHKNVEALTLYMLFTGMALFVDLFRLAAYVGDETHGEHALKGWLIFFNLLEFAVMFAGIWLANATKPWISAGYEGGYTSLPEAGQGPSDRPGGFILTPEAMQAGLSSNGGYTPPPRRTPPPVRAHPPPMESHLGLGLDLDMGADFPPDHPAWQPSDPNPAGTMNQWQASDPNPAGNMNQWQSSSPHSEDGLSQHSLR